jgi:hypothetical protein
MRADEEEGRRAFWWGMLPAVERGRALGLARLDVTRKDAALSTFSVLERERIHSALGLHIAHMTILQQCCGMPEERRPAVDPVGAVSRLAELEQQQEQTKRRRDEFARLQQEQQQEQGSKGQLH